MLERLETCSGDLGRPPCLGYSRRGAMLSFKMADIY